MLTDHKLFLEQHKHQPVTNRSTDDENYWLPVLSNNPVYKLQFSFRNVCIY